MAAKKRDRSIYMKERFHKIRQEGISKLGGKCVHCGTDKGLEFDHIDRSTKTISTGKIMSIALKTFFNELSKCQLLCRACHLKKTVSESSKEVHGTQWCYKKYKCRCKECVISNTQKNREYKLRKN